jgi:hypothetical protein
MTACADGPKSALAAPATMEIATMCQIARWPVAVRRASASAVHAITLSVPIITTRRLARSAMAPPTRPSTRTGRLPQKLIVPSSDAERVMS